MATWSNAAAAEELNDELAWYAELLGQVRDRDVLSRRLTELITDLPVDQVRGPVEAEITEALATERDEAMQRLNEAMGTHRYQHLIQLLRGWTTAPPLSDTADADSKTAIRYVKEAKRKADKRLRKADDDVELLHRARKAFKRARYGAELVEPADKKMKGIARDAKELQTLLGEHQDCMVAADFLARMSSDTGESAFTHRVLMANELRRAADIRGSLGTSGSQPVPGRAERGVPAFTSFE